KLTNPIISPLAIDVVITRLAWHRCSDKDMLTSPKRCHKVWDELLFDMFDKLNCPTKIKLAEVQRFSGVIVLNDDWTITAKGRITVYADSFDAFGERVIDHGWWTAADIH